MKLVQLLAKEFNEWPEGISCMVQDGGGEICTCRNGFPDPHDGDWTICGPKSMDTTVDWVDIGSGKHEIASDQKSSIITLEKWQAEREKMNKPKWIRHRGGKCPVDAATIVEVRLRCGDIQKHEACEFLWRHKDCDSAARIMAYRVIEETKDQEIEEVKKTNFGTITYKLEIDATEATQQIDSLVAKWGQIESPLKWRDAIIHCQAIIEDCEREIERNVNLLDAEGLMMQKDSKKAIQHYAPDVDMSDWRNWQAGDVIEIVANEGGHQFENGEEVIVVFLDLNDIDMSVKAEYKDGSDYWWLSGKDAKFIRRP